MSMSFSERTQHLSDAVGTGILRTSVEVNQAYAHYQHHGINRFSGGPLVYHRGGKAHFLRDALEEHYAEYLRSLARAVITEEGSRLESEAARVGETMAIYSEANTPFESGALKGSSHVQVISDGHIVYDHQPDVPRLDR